MRTFKTAGMLLALALSSAAFAFTSTSTGYSSATGTYDVIAQYGSKVTFTLPDSMLQIPAKNLRPGRSFTISIPVGNTTDRAIVITPRAVTVPGAVVTSPAAQTVPSGMSGDFVYNVVFDADTVAAASRSNAMVTFSFGFDAAETVSSADNLDFNNQP